MSHKKEKWFLSMATMADVEFVIASSYTIPITSLKGKTCTSSMEQRLRLLTEQLQTARGGNFDSVVVCEQVNEWAVGYGNEGGGMNPSSVYLLRKDRNGEERAHAYAFLLCCYLGYKTYIVRQFTDEAYVFLVRTLDAHTGEVRETHLDDCR